MKLLGGEWSRGDAIALVGVVVALVGSVAAILAIPGMPKLLHLDREDKQTKDPRSSAMAAVNSDEGRDIGLRQFRMRSDAPN